MSSRCRLVLLSGPGGSGTSTVAAATVQAARDEGLRARLVDVTSATVDADALGLLADAADALVGWVQADPVAPQAWSGLPGSRELSSWLGILAACEAPGIDLVVVDAGSTREARALMEFPAVAARLLGALLTPTLAMARPVAAPSPTTTWPSQAADEVPGEESSATAFDRVRALHERLTSAQALLESATMRLVAVPQPHAIDEVIHEIGMLAFLGVSVEGVVVNRVARKSDPVSSDERQRQADLLDRMAAHSFGAWVWKSTSSIKAVPKDRSVLGPLGGVPALRAEALEPVVRDEDFVLTVPLVGDAARQARVGRQGDWLVVAVEDRYRWLPMPPVLRRCRAVVADRTDAGLQVSFIPDVSLWRDPGSAA